MSLLALLGALLIGLTLGLLGSGGSILTVPVLVYLVGQPEKVAIAGSLAIVGGIALIGVLPRLRQGAVDLRSVVLFGLPGMVGTWCGSWASQFVASGVQMTLFALAMAGAAWSMSRTTPPRPAAQRHGALVVADGVGVGLLTGLVGVGGGFLIVPALVVLSGLAMTRAIGTSLMIIAFNSGIGLWKHLDLLLRDGGGLDWTLIGTFIAVGGIGSLGGAQLAGRLPQAALKRGFALFLVLLAAFILWHNLPGVLAGRAG